MVRGLSNIQFIENGFEGSGYHFFSDRSSSEIGTSSPNAVDFACEQAIATTEFACKVYSQDSGCPQRLTDRMHRQITNRLVKRGLDMVEIFRNRFRIYVLLGPPFYSALKLGI